MGMLPLIRNGCDFFKRQFILMSWLVLVTYLFYDTFVFYKNGRQFFHLRQILGLGLCVSRGTATVLNLCSALILLPLCKKMNQVLYWVLSKLWPELFFYWLENAKSFHITVAVTLITFAVIHSVSHFFNLWSFSRGYDDTLYDVNFAHYKNESPFLLLIMNQASLTGVFMVFIVVTMAAMSLRVVRRNLYNAFWYTHQLHVPLLILMVIHPLSGALKEEVLNETDTNNYSSHVENWNRNSTKNIPIFVPIKSKTWLWITIPFSCYVIDLIWRMFSRNLASVKILQVTHMPGRTMSITMSCPHERFQCRSGQYVLLQYAQISRLEWHPFTVIQLPTSTLREFTVWIKVNGDWTESLQRLLKETAQNKISVAVDGPFSSPMECVKSSGIAICVAAGVGITPFVPVIYDLLSNPRRNLPKRIHLLWIVRNEQEIFWIAELANKCILNLRDENRPDRLHLELYVTKSKEIENINKPQIVMINENNGGLRTIIGHKNNENQSMKFLQDIRKNATKNENEKFIYHNKAKLTSSRSGYYDLAKRYPVLGCRMKIGRPHWNRVFGYWAHLYPGEQIKLYCCGPKKLVKELRRKCREISRTTKLKLDLLHEGFS